MDQPLVSIFIITYNSSETILEALESAKNQTYSNIELIISDDYSSDNTVEICKQWLKENKHHFKNTVLVTSDKNTGVAPNCNRAVKASSGQWLKVLAGDDQLLPDSITDFVNFIMSHQNIDIVFGKFDFFGNNLEIVKKQKEIYENDFYPKIKLPQKDQFIEHLKKLFLPGPGLFFSRALYDDIGGYDEKYPMCEEESFTTYALEKNYHIKFFDKIIYRYRISETSLCRDKNQRSIHEKEKERFFFDYKMNLLIKNGNKSMAKYIALLYKIHDEENKRFIKKFILKMQLYFNPIFIKKKLNFNL